ncbi:MAG: LLM class F420-dependent oxidoreductase [Streptosporangiales bacterium]
MQYGVSMFPTHYAIDPGTLAHEVEQRGFASLLFPEHTHIPSSRRTPYPGGGELPRKYAHTLDPFVASTAAVLVTDRLLVGTGVCLVVERDPITVAKEVASVDHLSGGRFVFGVGAGWNREEMGHHGTDPRTRMALLAERVHAMKAIWTDDEAEFHGSYVDFESIWSWPKPVQRPHPPVLVGGMGPSVIDRVLDFGDEWLAQNVTVETAGDFAGRVRELQSRAADAGRGTVPVTMFNSQSTPEALERYAEAGVDRCDFGLPSGGKDEVLPELDRLAQLVA